MNVFSIHLDDVFVVPTWTELNTKDYLQTNWFQITTSWRSWTYAFLTFRRTEQARTCVWHVSSLCCFYSEVCRNKTALRTRRVRRDATHTSLERTFMFCMAVHHEWYGLSIFWYYPFHGNEKVFLGISMLPKLPVVVVVAVRSVWCNAKEI